LVSKTRISRKRCRIMSNRLQIKFSMEVRQREESVLELKASSNKKRKRRSQPRKRLYLPLYSRLLLILPQMKMEKSTTRKLFALISRLAYARRARSANLVTIYHLKTIVVWQSICTLIRVLKSVNAQTR